MDGPAPDQPEAGQIAVLVRGQLQFDDALGPPEFRPIVQGQAEV